jgi:hypothetical protein
MCVCVFLYIYVYILRVSAKFCEILNSKINFGKILHDVYVYLTVLVLKEARISVFLYYSDTASDRSFFY